MIERADRLAEGGIRNQEFGSRAAAVQRQRLAEEDVQRRRREQEAWHQSKWEFASG